MATNFLTNLPFRLLILTVAVTGNSAKADLVQDGSQLRGTFRVQEQIPDCYYSTTADTANILKPGLVVIEADETGVRLGVPTTLGSEVGDKMRVGTFSGTGVSGISTTAEGFYTAEGFFWKTKFFQAAADRTPETSTSISLIPDASANVVMTIVKYQKPNTSTQVCHFARVSP